jgi:hypothetical protein
MKFLIFLFLGGLSNIAFGESIPTRIDGVYCTGLAIPNFSTATAEGTPAGLNRAGKLVEYAGIRHVDVGHELVHISKYLDAYNFLEFILFSQGKNTTEIMDLIRGEDLDIWKLAILQICDYYKIDMLSLGNLPEDVFVLQNIFHRIFDAVRMYKWTGIDTLHSPDCTSNYGKFLIAWNLFWNDSGDAEAEFLCIMGDGSNFDFNENELLRETDKTEALQRWSHRTFESANRLLTQGSDEEKAMAHEVIELGRCLIYERRISEFFQNLIKATAPPISGFDLGNVRGDGNCLQRALAVIIHGNEDSHGPIRGQLFGVALRVIETQTVDQDLQRTLHGVQADHYARWLLAIFRRNENRFPAGAPQAINALNLDETTTIENLLPTTFGMWQMNNYAELLWIYANAVLQYDGGWGELIDVALAAYAFRRTIIVHTATQTITYNQNAAPQNPWHIFNNAQGNMAGTHWQPYLPID